MGWQRLVFRRDGAVKVLGGKTELCQCLTDCRSSRHAVYGLIANYDRYAASFGKRELVIRLKQGVWRGRKSILRLNLDTGFKQRLCQGVFLREKHPAFTINFKRYLLCGDELQAAFCASRQRLNLELKSLEAKGVLRIGKELLITDMAALQSMSSR